MERDREPLERLSEGEERFERLRRRAGLIAAPAIFALLLLLPLPGLSGPAHHLAAVMATVMVLWVTEALPMPVTALLGVTACVVLRVAPAKEAFAPFADPLMFLFIGSFILARAIFVHHLDRRLAFGVLSLRWVGGRPSRILFAFGAVTAFISAWISNTATTAMMFAIGMSILAFLYDNEKEGGSRISRRYATGLMLMTAFAASIGGLATPIGTPPNIIGLGYIRADTGIEISFFKWSMIGVPVVVCLYLFMFAYLNLLCPASSRELTGSREMLERSKRELGPWTRGQISTLVACLFTVALWITPGVLGFVYGETSEPYQVVSKRMP